MGSVVNDLKCLSFHCYLHRLIVLPILMPVCFSCECTRIESLLLW